MVLEIFENNNVSEDLIRQYNDIGVIAKEGQKDYYEFFHLISRCLLLHDKGFDVYEQVVNTYKTVNTLSEKDEEFILLAFKINESIYTLKDKEADTMLPLVERALELCQDLNIYDKETLFRLNRQKLRYLLGSNSEVIDTFRAAKLKETKNYVEAALLEQENEAKIEKDEDGFIYAHPIIIN